MALDLRQCLAFSSEQRRKLADLIDSDSEAAARSAEMLAEAVSYLNFKPQPLEVIHFEGLLNTDPARIETTRHLYDMDHLGLFVSAQAALGEDCFAQQVRAYVTAWASTYKPTGNPINERMLEAVLAGYDLLSPEWSPEEKMMIETWMRRVAELEIESARMRPGSTRNNWHTKRLSLVGQIGVILKDQPLIDYAVDGYHEYIGVGLYPDGSTEDFHKRDALSYHQSGLKPLLILARMMLRNGIKLFEYQHSNGVAVRRSIDFMIPFLDGTNVHAEFVNTQADIDHRRAAAGIPFYKTGKPYDPRDALELFELATFFDPAYLDIVRRITNSSAQRYPTWLAVACAG